MTGLECIKAALRIIGAIATAETPSSNESNDALQTLNDLIDSWSNQRLMVPTLILTPLTLVSGKASYTFGPSGDITTRPIRFDPSAYIRINVDVDLPLRYCTQTEYDSIRTKQTTSTFPTHFFPDLTYPQATVTFWPVPRDILTVYLRTEQGLTGFADLYTDYSLQPGWARMLKYNLARELCAEYGKPVTPVIEAIAASSLATLKRVNIPRLRLGTDVALNSRSGYYDYRSDR